MEQGISTFTPALIATWTLIAVSLLVLGTLAYGAIRNRTRPADLDQAVQAFRSVDIEAFKNLVDPAEDEFLRDHLPPKKFRDIKRQRAWAALIYTWEVGKSAKALALVGQAARRSSDPAMVASAVQLTENALQLRLDSIQASFHFLGQILLPGLKPRTLPRLVDRYRQSADTLMRLGGLSSRVLPSRSESA
jgi:hypothetical protein